jgi:N-acyl amino acid synthase FeeM
MKELLRSVWIKFRRTKSPAVSKPRAKRRSGPSDTRSPGFVATVTRTGETIYDHRALRFQSLTLNAADLALLENPSQIRGGFKIRVAKQPGGRRHAGTLVEKRYTGRGYTTSQSDQDPSLSTFIAFDEGMLVGTVSVRLDSEQGVSADELYRAELDEMRDAGYRLCEFTRLAVDKTVASKPVLAGLFHTAYLYAAVIRGYTHAVIEVNPRHVTFYRRALDFELVGEKRMNLRVKAPAVLLRVPFATIAQNLKLYAGKPHVAGASRSLYPYGFPEGEEVGVLARLRVLAGEH